MVRYNLDLAHYKFVNLCGIRILETIPSNKIAPTIPMQTQMIDNDKLNKPIMKKDTIGLVSFVLLRHFKQDTMQTIGHVERVSHINHKQMQVVEEHKSVLTFAGHKLLNYH